MICLYLINCPSYLIWGTASFLVKVETGCPRLPRAPEIDYGVNSGNPTNQRNCRQIFRPHTLLLIRHRGIDLRITQIAAIERHDSTPAVRVGAFIEEARICGYVVRQGINRAPREASRGQGITVS